MKKFMLDNIEKERIKKLYENYRIQLTENKIFGKMLRGIAKMISQSEDDISKSLSQGEGLLVRNSVDEIVNASYKVRNLTQLDDLQKILMHAFNPTNTAEGVAAAQQKMVKFLNGYAKSRGKKNWQQFRDEVGGGYNTNPKTPPKTNDDDHVKVMYNPIGASAYNKLSGNRISNRSFSDFQPNWGDITNAKNWDDYNKFIAKAIETNNFSYISAKGFEKLGITNFRDFLKNNILKVNEVDSSIGRWSVNFKPVKTL